MTQADSGERNDVIKYVRGTSRDPIFEVAGLGFGYPSATVPVLCGLSFALFAGETLAVIGSSGCGTSTLALILAGLVPADEGKITLNGSGKAALPPGRYSRAVTLASHDPALPPGQPAWQIAADPLAVRTTKSRGERRAAAEALLAQVGLPAALTDHTPAQLSLEHQQLVALARALILTPKVLICDRITAALSPLATARVLNLLVELQEHQGLSMIFAAHDLAVVHHIADRVLVLHEGCAVEYDAAAHVLHRPQHALTYRLVHDQPPPL